MGLLIDFHLFELEKLKKYRVTERHELTIIRFSVSKVCHSIISSLMFIDYE